MFKRVKNRITSQMSVEIDPAVLEKTKRLPSELVIVFLTIRNSRLVINEKLHATSFDQIKNQLPDTEPGLVFVQYKLSKNGRIAYPCCLIHFNPPQIPVQMAMIYSKNVQTFAHQLRCQGVYSVRDVDEIDAEQYEEWMGQSFLHY